MRVSPQAARWTLWLTWAAFLAGLALTLVIPGVVSARPRPWYEAQTSVAGFVLALLSLVVAVGTFTLRETLALRELRLGALEPGTAAGYARVRSMLIVLWALCLLIGGFGAVLAWGAAAPRAGWPYTLGAALLLGVHAPRRWLFSIPAAPGADRR